MSEPRTTTTRLHASDRRLQLVETALDFFSRKGFGGTTTKEIASAAGVTEAIIFRHFPTKQDLYNAVLDHHHNSSEVAECMQHLNSCMERNDDEGLVRTLIERVIEEHRRDLRVHRLMLFAALEGHETALEYSRQFSMAICDQLCQYIARRQALGAIRPGDPIAIVAAAYGMAKQYATMTQLFGFPIERSDREVADCFVSIIMHGIQQHPRTKSQSLRNKK